MKNKSLKKESEYQLRNISDIIDDLCNEIGLKESEIEELEEKVKDLESQIQDLKDKLTDYE